MRIPHSPPYVEVACGTGGKMLALLYRTEQRNGWSVGMRAVTHALLADVRVPDGPVLELGCGGGRLLAELSAHETDQFCCGLEIDPHALSYAKATITTRSALVQAQLCETPFADETFALCLAMDAFDQQDVELCSALAECSRILVPDGILMMRVSAHPWLQGPHDAAFNTGSRYRKSDLFRGLTAAGFAVQRLTYANMLLSGPAAAVRLLQRWRLIPFMPALYTRRVLNYLLTGALHLEADWLYVGDLPLGMSLYAIARKPRHRRMPRDD